MTHIPSVELPWLSRLTEGLAARWRSLRAHDWLNFEAVAEARRDRAGGHPVDPDHGPHLREALDWLARAQDATPDDGFSRAYHVGYNAWRRSHGWQPSYPETTGYIIPTLLEAARRLDRPDLTERALRAARWECRVQLPEGAVIGGVIGEGQRPAVFNTGQVMLGWLAVWEATGDAECREALRRAGQFLVDVLEPDGHWRKGNSPFARANATLYNARVAWALAEAGKSLQTPSFTDAAARNLRATALRQAPNGWIPDCCLSGPDEPLLHTLAYAIRGLLEGGRVLQDQPLLDAGARAARVIAGLVREDGWLPGRFRSDWSGAVSWSCLTGQAQMVNNWIRLHLITGEQEWLEPVPRVVRFLKSTQNRASANPGLRGGIKGSFPFDGEYGRFELLNWAAKYFADALLRDLQLRDGTARDRMEAYRLA